MSKLNKVTKSTYTSLVFLFLYLPIFILIIYSFNNAQYSLLWHGFTLAWYQELWADTDLWSAALNSLSIGVIASTVATLLGVFGALSLYRYRFFGKDLVHGLVFILIVTPDIVMAVSLLVLCSTLKIELGFWSLLIGHITFCLPFVVVSVYSRIIGIDKNIFEAAKDLGASDFTVFLKIIVPLLWPAMLAGWLLSFTLSFDDVIISYFISGPEFQILPLAIYAMVRHGMKPEINALCSVTFIMTLFIVVTAQLALRKE